MGVECATFWDELSRLLICQNDLRFLGGKMRRSQRSLLRLGALAHICGRQGQRQGQGQVGQGVPIPSSAAHCLTTVCRTWRSTTMTNRPLAPLLLSGSTSFSNNLFLYLTSDHSTPSPMKNMHTSYLFKSLNPFHPLPHLFPPAKRLTTGWTSLGKQEKPSLTN